MRVERDAHARAALLFEQAGDGAFGGPAQGRVLDRAVPGADREPDLTEAAREGSHLRLDAAELRFLVAGEVEGRVGAQDVEAEGFQGACRAAASPSPQPTPS